MCSSSSAFIQMSPCALEITGISGSLQIYGVGTALFLGEDSIGNPVVVRIHNSLCGQGEFNLISVSQLVQQKGNCVDFSLKSPYLTLDSSGPKRRHFRLPLFMDDGLFSLALEPLQTNDPRYSRYPKCDVTPGGIFSLCTAETTERWRAKVLVSGTPSARILVAPGIMIGICNLSAAIFLLLHQFHQHGDSMIRIPKQTCLSSRFDSSG